MWNFLLNLVQVNEEINYSLIISIVASYLLLMWFVVCIWVFFDAKKRYESITSHLFFFLFVLLFGIPALIFYIMIRPEHTLEEDYYMNLALSGEKEVAPIFFDGENGFDISINLSIDPKKEKSDKHKMVMDFEWTPRKMVKKPGKKSPKVTGLLGSFGKSIKYQFDALSGTVRKGVSAVQSRTKNRKMKNTTNQKNKEELTKKDDKKANKKKSKKE